MKYSFVLPAYKARFFKEAIDSILAQTYTDFELIIVNDASPENLDSIIKRYDDSRIRYYVNEQNIGGKDLVAQWNHCLEYARGDYVILASDDDIYHLDYLEKMDILVQRYPDVNVFRPRVQAINEQGKIIKVFSLLSEVTSQYEFAYFLPEISRGIPFYIFKTKSLISNGGFVSYPLAWYSDDATIINMSKNGVAFSKEILFSFRISGESISSKQNNSIILRQKILAAYSFYNDLYNLVAHIKYFNSRQEAFYYYKIITENKSRLQEDVKCCVFSSTKGAIINNLLLLLRLRIFAFRSLVGLYIRRLLM